jgi:hypothetical protein
MMFMRYLVLVVGLLALMVFGPAPALCAAPVPGGGAAPQ